MSDSLSTSGPFYFHEFDVLLKEIKCYGVKLKEKFPFSYMLYNLSDNFTICFLI